MKTMTKTIKKNNEINKKEILFYVYNDINEIKKKVQKGIKLWTIL